MLRRLSISLFVTFIMSLKLLGFSFFKSQKLSWKKISLNFVTDISIGNFDSDFADMMSKPLPDWYQEETERREKVKKEEEERRQQIFEDFRIKYDLSLDEKIKAGLVNKPRKNSQDLEKQKSWLQKAMSYILDDNNSDSISDENDLKTTQENWRKFLEEEKKDTGFYLPGFFEVFPELKIKWPIWSKRKNGRVIPCEKDEDCQFPQACCAHPFLPGEKFCCTGLGKRVMVPAYVGQEALAERGPAYQRPDGRPEN